MIPDGENTRLFLSALESLIEVYEEEGDNVPIGKLKALLEHYDLNCPKNI